MTTTSNARNGESWVKLFHRFKDWEWYKDIKTKTLFLHILLSVNYSTGKWRGIEVPRGSFVTSREKLADETGLSEQEVRTAIKHLKSTNEITTQATSRYTIITLCKYDLYQSTTSEEEWESNQPSNQPPTNNQPTINQQSTTSIEYKKDRKIEYIVVDEMTREEFFNFFFSEQRQGVVKQLCMARNFGSIENFKALAKRVLAEWEGEPHATIKEANQHLINHCSRKQSAERREQTTRPAAANRQTDKAPRRVNDQWEGFEVPTE